MAKIAVIGTGFSGLGVASFLSSYKKVSVTLFDQKGLAKGASGIAAGLMHPYPGKGMKRSKRADEALKVADELFSFAKSVEGRPLYQEGIEKVCMNEEEARILERHMQYGDIERLGEKRFLIKSGKTVYAKRYLHALLSYVIKQGGTLEERKISSLEDLKKFDRVIVAAGPGIFSLLQREKWPLKEVKGQTIIFASSSLKRSVIGSGYVALLEEGKVVVGSTYERGFASPLPEKNRETALMLSQVREFFEEVENLKEEKMESGIRVSRVGHYFPLMGQFDQKTYFITGMGSRGLLYHALFGKEMAENVMGSL